MNILGLKQKDEEKLKKMLNSLKELNEDLGAKYSLRADLRDINNRSFNVGNLLQGELDKIKNKQLELEEACKQTLIVKSRIESYLSTIKEIEERLEKNDDGESLYSRILEITSEDNIDHLEELKNEIVDKYNQLFLEDDDGEILVNKITFKIKEIEDKYSELFEERNDDGENIFEALETKISKTSEIWEEYFKEDEYGKTKSELIDGRLKEINQFHLKVFGDESNEKVSLDKELKERLKNLKDIEKQAKETLDRSSEAGLAGGFVVKRKEANTARLISLGVFITVVVFMFGFNIWLFDETDFKNMDLHKILFKITINAPLIWIATIANVNLNRFSKLEQEYSHKESLAMTYERYRTEIEQLAQLGINGADDLRVKLLNTNLDAFKLNPATSTSDRKGLSFYELAKLKLIGRNN